METKILSKGDSYKSEYCCSIIKIGEVKPIEGKDKIGYTLVNGETIVVRKDQVKEGDILIYASNETQLEKDFLSANNLFESSSFELNSNASEVEPYVLKNRELKGKVENIEKAMKKLLVCSKFMIDYESLYLAAESEDEKKELDTRLDNSRKTVIKYVGASVNENSTLKDYVLESQKYCAEKKIEIDNLNSEIEGNADFIRSHTGFFNKTGRVRAIRLGGVQSMGYLFNLDELARYNPNVKDINLEEYVGEDFDTVDGKLFVKAYVPYVPERRTSSKSEKRNKKIKRFNRMIEGEFYYHYDTAPLPKCINRVKPTDCVSISYKIHGTSVIIGKLHVKQPLKLPLHKWLWNKFIDITGLFKSKRVTDYTIEYGNVTSSRTVIKNQYINMNVTEGYYGVDIWSEYGNLIYPYLDEGMTVYGEIFGYLTDSDKMIQKQYDYGCEVGKNKMMVYRITTTNENGTKREWEISEVKEWTERLVKEHPEIADRIHVIDVLYHGTLQDLYPELSLTEHWHENVVANLRNDKKRFHMETNDPLCKNKVPFEGIVLRIDGDEIKEAFKLKCEKFLSKERKDMDEGNVDIEMVNNYVDDGDGEL
jgi:hypothetical protein